MKNIKFLTLLFAIVASLGTTFAESGTCGENLTWDLTDSVLTISGKGNMPNWGSYRDVPWYNNVTPKGFLPIQHVIIEKGVTSIGDYAFKNCSTIVSISMPNTLSYIGREAFRYANITSLTIPSSVETIESSAFYYCSNLLEVKCLPTTPPSIPSRIFNNNSLSIIVPCGSLSDYKSHNYWYKSSWTYQEGAFDYSLSEDIIVLQEPTCNNGSTLIIQAKEKEGYFFDQWNDGNTDNPRSIQLESNEHVDISAEYIHGTKMIVCKGYEFVYPETETTYVIDNDSVVGNYYFFVKTNNIPLLNVEDYPIYQTDFIYCDEAENEIRRQYTQINTYVDSIESVTWSYSVSEDKKSDTYVTSSELIEGDYNYVWVKYEVKTECGTTFSDTMQVSKTTGVPMPSDVSMSGREFWVGMILGYSSGSENTINPYIAVSAQNECNIRIYNPNRTDWSGMMTHVSAGSWTIIDSIPLEFWYPAGIWNDAGKADGIKYHTGLVVESDKDIEVYAAQYIEFSYDMTQVLPITMLRSEYMTQDYPPYNRDGVAVSEIVIVAAEDNTSVDITPSSTTYSGHTANTTYSVSLSKGEVYYVISQDKQSLSGSRVVARDNKKIAVFTGDNFTQVPNGVAARDCLYEQAIPVDYWGRQFVVTRSMEKDANRVRVTALEDGTELGINAHKVVVLNAGETYEFEMSVGDLSKNYSRLVQPVPDIIYQDAVYLESSCPVAVYSYDVGRNYQATETEMYSEKGGDPSMVWVTPLDQRKNNVYFGLGKSGYRHNNRHFVNIVCPTESTSETRLQYGWYDRSSTLEFTPVPGKPEYSYARVYLGDKEYQIYDNASLKIYNPSGVVGYVYSNGEDDSYAFSLSSGSMTTGLMSINGQYAMVDEPVLLCYEDSIYFKMNIFGSTAIDRIDWDFGDGQKKINADFELLHEYSQPGQYDVKVKLYTHKDCPFTLYEPRELTYQLNLHTPDTVVRNYAMCEGVVFIHNGAIYYGAASDTIVYGCDSVEIFSLTINDCHVETPDTVTVNPGVNEAEIRWPIWQGAFTYTLIVWADKDKQIMLCELTFNAAGVLIDSKFGSPSYAAKASSTIQASKRQFQEAIFIVFSTTLDFVVTGLEADHTYYYELHATNEEEQVIETRTGSFTTKPEIITGISNANANANAVKIIRNGQLLILRGEDVYTVTGQKVK